MKKFSGLLFVLLGVAVLALTWQNHALHRELGETREARNVHYDHFRAVEAGMGRDHVVAQLVLDGEVPISELERIDGWAVLSWEGEAKATAGMFRTLEAEYPSAVRAIQNYAAIWRHHHEPKGGAR